ncbi:MAG: NrpR regulatory domain-containing protein [Candidatus Margulisbacteria bacterium]|nr:NrpR regulatory domain-containing protein [Candidatus Margulisiibacteriota bacterium]
MQDIEKKINAVLKIIADAKEPIGSAEISQKLKDYGYDLTERAVRYHLKIMNDRGLVKGFWKEGRMITSKGIEELKNSLVSDKVGLVSSRIETMSYLMDFDLEKRAGSVILNISFFHKSEFKKALKIMREVFEKKLGMGKLVFVAQPGEEIGGVIVPKGKVGFGTLCTINLNGILLKHSIPVESKFGGVLQIEEGKPTRFTDLISYAGSTLDPHEIFLRSKMTSVREATSGSGKILAGLREIPAISRQAAETVLVEAEEAGLGNTLYIGRPNQPVLGMLVGVDRVGVVIPGGLNPVAAAEEWGIETDSRALTALVDFAQLISFNKLV